MIQGLSHEHSRAAWNNKYNVGWISLQLRLFKRNICFENNEARCNIKSLIEYRNDCKLKTVLAGPGGYKGIKFVIRSRLHERHFNQSDWMAAIRKTGRAYQGRPNLSSFFRLPLRFLKLFCGSSLAGATDFHFRSGSGTVQREKIEVGWFQSVWRPSPRFFSLLGGLRGAGCRRTASLPEDNETRSATRAIRYRSTASLRLFRAPVSFVLSFQLLLPLSLSLFFFLPISLYLSLFLPPLGTYWRGDAPPRRTLTRNYAKVRRHGRVNSKISPCKWLVLFYSYVNRMDRRQ